MSRSITARIRASLRSDLAHRGGVLLAVSGGADSMVLLAACAPLRDAGVAVEVAWIDHGVRAESAEEGALVERTAAAHGLAFHARRLSLSLGPGFEARARGARELALESVRQARGLALIATGHTASDQAETLLMRLARGAALRGAAGIRARRGALVRPMLSVTRDEVRACARAMGLVFCQDPMNEDLSFLRVRVRVDVLPTLAAAVGSDVVSRLARFAALAAEDDAFLEEQAFLALHRLRMPLHGGPSAGLAINRVTPLPGPLSAHRREGTGPDGGHIAPPAEALEVVGLRALPAPLRRRVLHRWVRERLGPLDGERLDAALVAVETGRHCDLRDGIGLACEGGRVRLVDAHGSEPLPAVPLEPSSAAVSWDGGRWMLGISMGSVAPDVDRRYPLATLPGPLEVRVRARADRVRLGDGRTRAVADVMIDAKLPRELRERWPLVAEVGGQVLWVPGALRARAVEGAVAWLWAEATS